MFLDIKFFFVFLVLNNDQYYHEYRTTVSSGFQLGVFLSLSLNLHFTPVVIVVV